MKRKSTKVIVHVGSIRVFDERHRFAGIDAAKRAPAVRLRRVRAVREAAGLDWPPRALGFRLIDREGREIFGRDRGYLPANKLAAL